MSNDVKCRRCGRKIPKEQAICIERKSPQRITVETIKTSYQTTKWLTDKSDGRILLCFKCSDRFTKWLDEKNMRRMENETD